MLRHWFNPISQEQTGWFANQLAQGLSFCPLRL